jgi:hypothetical protein
MMQEKMEADPSLSKFAHVRGAQILTVPLPLHSARPPTPAASTNAHALPTTLLSVACAAGAATGPVRDFHP